MLPFRDALNNDNPVSDELNLHELNKWYFALILIGSNLFGAPLVVYCHKHAFFLLGASTFVAVLFSLLYHTCQTTHVCFGFSLSVLTLADHISAPTFMMMLILFIINTKSAKQIRHEVRERAQRYIREGTFDYNEEPVLIDIEPQQIPEQQASLQQSPPPLRPPPQQRPNYIRFLKPLTYDNGLKFANNDSDNKQPLKLKKRPQRKYEIETNLSDEQIEEIEASKTYHHIGYGHTVSNDENNAWGVYITYSSIFVVILAALAHNFSLQAFVIAFVYGLGAIFFKHVIIDEGVSLGMYERVSLVDLITGVLLLALSLVFYILDIYVAYAITHSLWHMLSFGGAYLMVIGLTKHCDNWYSPIDFCYRKTLKHCLRHTDDDTVIPRK